MVDASDQDCGAAQCVSVTWTPEAGGIEAGEGLRHIGCRVTVPGCFAEVCAAQRALCPVEVP